jgi:NIMA (never in mitosis gene a)-related kinase
VFNWTLQIVQALKYLHSFGQVHGDLKPENIFISESNGIKLAGLTVAILNEKCAIKHSLLDSLDYMSPEMMKREKHSFKSDIWSLGCIVYEVTFLRKAFAGSVLDQERNGESLCMPETALIPALIRRYTAGILTPAVVY